MSGATTKPAAIWKVRQRREQQCSNYENNTGLHLLCPCCVVSERPSAAIYQDRQVPCRPGSGLRVAEEARQRASEWNVFVGRHRPFGYRRSTFAVLAPRRRKASSAQSRSRPQPRLGPRPESGRFARAVPRP